MAALTAALMTAWASPARPDPLVVTFHNPVNDRFEYAHIKNLGELARARHLANKLKWTMCSIYVPPSAQSSISFDDLRLAFPNPSDYELLNGYPTSLLQNADLDLEQWDALSQPDYIYSLIYGAQLNWMVRHEQQERVPYDAVVVHTILAYMSWRSGRLPGQHSEWARRDEIRRAVGSVILRTQQGGWSNASESETRESALVQAPAALPPPLAVTVSVPSMRAPTPPRVVAPVAPVESIAPVGARMRRPVELGRRPTYLQLADRLEEEGFVMIRTRGSHRTYRQLSSGRQATLAPHGWRDRVPAGTLASILTSCGLRER